MYFKDCNTIDEAKTLFRKLCKELHPDKGGKQSDFIKMFNEFKAFKPKTDKHKQAETFNADKFYDLIQKFEGLKDIEINFVGSWIFLTDIKVGATYLQKEAIKAINLDSYESARFSKSKKAWYFMPKGTKVYKKRGKSLDKLKNTYGCDTFKTKTNLELSN